jgi:hypothetical protein
MDLLQYDQPILCCLMKEVILNINMFSLCMKHRRQFIANRKMGTNWLQVLHIEAAQNSFHIALLSYPDFPVCFVYICVLSSQASD